MGWRWGRWSSGSAWIRFHSDMARSTSTATTPTPPAPITAPIRVPKKVATSLGRGIGALVNLHDPQVVTLGGVAALVRAQAADAFDAAFLDALMAFRKASPPPVRDAEHGEDGPRQGAIIAALDHVTTPDALAEWVARQRD